MIRSRWLVFQGVALAVGLLCITGATAQRGGMCPYLFSMSQQINVQMNARPPMQSMNMFAQQSFNNRGGSPFGMNTMGRSSCSSGSMTSVYRKPPAVWPSQSQTLHVNSTPHYILHDSTFHSQVNLFHPSLVNYRNTTLFGNLGRDHGVQHLTGRVTSFTTVSLHRTTRTLSTSNPSRSIHDHPQIDLVCQMHHTEMPGMHHSMELTEMHRSRPIQETEKHFRPLDPEMTTNRMMDRRVHQPPPEMHTQITTKVSATCGRCHANGVPQNGQVARLANPQPQQGALPLVPQLPPTRIGNPLQPGGPLIPGRVVPAVVRQPVVPNLLAVPALPDLLTLNQTVAVPTRPTAFSTPSKTNTTVQATPVRSTTSPSTDSTLAQPFDRPQLPVILDAPPLPVDQTVQPAFDRATDILDRLPQATTGVSRPAPVASVLNAGDVFGAPGLPGGVALTPLVADAPEEVEPARADTYQGLPPLPPVQPGPDA